MALEGDKSIGQAVAAEKSTKAAKGETALRDISNGNAMGRGFCSLPGRNLFYGRRCPEKMRTAICEIVLILLLIDAPTHPGFCANEARQAGGEKAFAILCAKTSIPVGGKGGAHSWRWRGDPRC